MNRIDHRMARPTPLLPLLMVALLAFLLTSCTSAKQAEQSAALGTTETHLPRWTMICGVTNPTLSWAMTDDRAAYFQLDKRMLVLLNLTTGKPIASIEIPAELAPSAQARLASFFVKRSLYYRAGTGPMVRVSDDGGLQALATEADLQKAIENDGGTLSDVPSAKLPFIRFEKPELQHAYGEIDRRYGSISHTEVMDDRLLVIYSTYSTRTIANGLAQEHTRDHDVIALFKGHDAKRIWSHDHGSLLWVGMAEGAAIILVRDGNDRSSLTAFDTKTGTTRWAIPVTSVRPGRTRINGRNLLTVDAQGTVSLIDAGTGAVTKRGTLVFDTNDGYRLNSAEPPFLYHGDTALVCTDRVTEDGITRTLHCIDLRAVPPGNGHPGR